MEEVSTPLSVPKRRFPDGAAVLGIDLRSSARYPTGVAALDARLRVRLLRRVRADDELLAVVEQVRPSVVAIDAPLGLPEGRDCADPACECARFGIMREIDRACARAGYRPFPTLLPSMVNVTLRGIALARQLTAGGATVIEVYPGMAQDQLGIPRKRLGVAALANGLRRNGVRGLPRRPPSHDELDAVTCALVARLYARGEAGSADWSGSYPFVTPGPALARS